MVQFCYPDCGIATRGPGAARSAAQVKVQPVVVISAATTKVRTARIMLVAARGTRAAVGDAGGRVPQRRFAPTLCKPRGRIPSGTQLSRFLKKITR